MPLFSERVLGISRAMYGVRDLFAMAMDGSSEAVHKPSKIAIRNRLLPV